jgi:hypothetical protein
MSDWKRYMRHFFFQGYMPSQRVLKKYDLLQFAEVAQAVRYIFNTHICIYLCVHVFSIYMYMLLYSRVYYHVIWLSIHLVQRNNGVFKSEVTHVIRYGYTGDSLWLHRWFIMVQASIIIVPILSCIYFYGYTGKLLVPQQNGHEYWLSIWHVYHVPVRCTVFFVHSFSSGNLLSLNKALEKNEAFFIKCGIYLILEKLKIITYRNLFKKV